MECPYDNCKNSLKPWNSATNFANPALSVKLALDAGIILARHKVLELGGGNLRNARYVMSRLPSVKYNVTEKIEVVNRFHSEYDDFEHRGGRLVKEQLTRRTFDVLISTFVLETICPSSQRIEVLLSACKALKNGGILIVSFRGYPGVKGTKYKQCAAGEGFITPHSTFIKPFSIPEVQNLLEAAGFINFVTLEKYRVESPQNIHIEARLEGKQ